MKSRAAILRESPGKWEVVEVDVDEPRDREVRVRLAAAGLCHTDHHAASGEMQGMQFPICGGHEGSGVVEAVGPGVADLRAGDHIVTSFIPSCGRCRWCASGMQNMCDNGAQRITGAQLDGTRRMHIGGEDVGQFFSLGTFSEYSVMPEWACIKIPRHIPFECAALVSCGVPTGWGSAVNAAQVEPGDVVIVMGVGGVGINAVQGAGHCGAMRVIAVDPVAFKREKALGLGATDAVAGMEEATELARSLTNGQGADSAIVTTGTVTGEHVSQAFGSIRKAGIVVVTGAANLRQRSVPISLLELTSYQKRIQGALYGMMAPSKDVPRLLALYEQGKLKVDELVTKTYALDEINAGYDDLHAGVNIRGVIRYDTDKPGER